MDNTHSHSDSDEQQKLLQITLGNQQAFTAIVRQYMPPVYRHLLLYIRDAHLAQELAQDIFLSLWHNRGKLADMENFPGYVYVMTRNKARRALREALEQTDEPPEDMVQTLLNSPETNLELKELKALLEKGISLLPKRRQEVFRLSRIDQRSYEEIAEALHISKSAVRQHIIAAMAFLRDFVKSHGGVIISLLFASLAGCSLNFFSM